ncbi:hypothetical protein JL721_4223 [Aureococcus anophagefferens]|nr:hypothetical protein JL721_4223 [Aureococcus anophagefferens]
MGGRLLEEEEDAAAHDSTALIVVNQLCERFAWYVFSGTYIMYSTRALAQSSVVADASYSNWNALTYLCPLLGGLVADVWLGRYRTVRGAFAVYVVGAVGLCVAAAYPTPWLFYASVLVLAFGAGSAKPNVSALGADQVPDEAARERYFGRLYAAMNAGSTLAFTMGVSVAQTYGFLPAWALATAVLGASARRSRPVRRPPRRSPRSPLVVVVHVLGDALRGGSSTRRGGARAAAATTTTSTWCGRCGTSRRASASCVFWGAQAQTTTTLFNQACQLNLHGWVPVASLAVFNSGCIVALMPVCDDVVFPALRRRGVAVTTTRRIVAGMGVLALCLGLGALLERRRLFLARRGLYAPRPSPCYADGGPKATLLSVAWQVPVFSLSGLAEVLAGVAAMEHFYAVAPPRAKSLCSAIELVSVSLGFLFGGCSVVLANAASPPWVPTDLDGGRLDVFLGLWAALLVASTALYARAH